MIKSTNYLTIQGWMVTELGLKGNELLVYAIIYGFSQDEDQVFSGSRRYIAEWLNVDVKSVGRILKSLTEKEFIHKGTKVINDVTFCEYWVNPRMIPRLENPKNNF